MKPRIVPAILRYTFKDIVSATRRVEDLTHYVQIDIVDGIFLPVTPTWPFGDGQSPNEFSALGSLTLQYELDLFIAHPEDYLPALLSTPATRLIFHVTSTSSLLSCVTRCKEAGKEAYIGIGRGVSLTLLEDVVASIDGVQCMSIQSTGVQGEPYDPSVEETILQLRDRYPTLPISVDGGISQHQIPRLCELGVSQMAVGSALFKGDTTAAFKALNEALC